jgi:translation initiation factor IF-3
MEIDNVKVGSFDKASKKAKVDIDKAAKIFEGFYKGITHILETEKTVIKIDYFGKFIYSQAWKDKKAQLNKEYIEFHNLNIEKNI